MDGPGGPSVATILGPGGPSMATKIAIDSPGGTDFGGTIGGMTGPSLGSWYASRLGHIHISKPRPGFESWLGFFCI